MNLKIRLINGDTYPALRGEIVKGRFEFDFEDMTCEEIQNIFTDKSNLATIELLTVDDGLYGVYPGWTVYGGVTLVGDVKTLILTQETDPLQERLTNAESKALEVKTMIEDLKENGVPFEKNKMLNASVTLARMSAQNLTDSKALEVKDIYDTWKDLVQKSFVAEKAGYKFTHNEKLYKTVHNNQKFSSEWVPGEGTESIFTHIDEAHTGTLEDPIPAETNMEYVKGLYYLEDGKIYLMNRKGMSEGESIVLQFLPSALVGQYFELV